MDELIQNNDSTESTIAASIIDDPDSPILEAFRRSQIFKAIPY